MFWTHRSPGRRHLRALAAFCVVVTCTTSARSASAAELTEKLHIFGHLTQAYGESNRGSILGATEGGTTDLSMIAVQFRWELSETDTAVVQFSHERNSNDIFSPQQDEVEIDWAFYEKRFASDTTLKIGRLNVPLGIYNEIRDVGTLLPFFNLPISFYAGVLNSAETVDGISVGKHFGPRSEWNLEAEVYFGGWDTVQQRVDNSGEFRLTNLEARAEDGVGLQLWLNTPVDEIRIGAGTLTWLLEGPVTAPGTKDRWDTHHISLDVNLEKWMLRAEYRSWRFDQDFGAFLSLPVSLPGRAERDGYYVQAGAWITSRIGLFGQFEDTSLSNDLNLLADENDLHQDLAFSLNYRVRAYLLIKAEYHSASTRLPLGDVAAEDDDGRPRDVDWALVSFSVSF